MTTEEFLKMFDDFASLCRSLLCKKDQEYKRGEDKLWNFKRAAHLERCTPERALRSMMTKHIINIYDYIDDLEEGGDHSLDQWDEKIMDSVNYLFLLRALLKEREDKNERFRHPKDRS